MADQEDDGVPSSNIGDNVGDKSDGETLNYITLQYMRKLEEMDKDIKVLMKSTEHQKVFQEFLVDLTSQQQQDSEDPSGFVGRKKKHCIEDDVDEPLGEQLTVNKMRDKTGSKKLKAALDKLEDIMLDDILLWCRTESPPQASDELFTKKYETKVVRPLLRVLEGVGEVCTKWSGNAKHIGLFRYFKQPEVKVDGLTEHGLIKVAMKDICGVSNNGLAALHDALQELISISEECENTQKVVELLEEINEDRTINDDDAQHVSLFQHDLGTRFIVINEGVFKSKLLGRKLFDRKRSSSQDALAELVLISRETQEYRTILDGYIKRSNEATNFSVLYSHSYGIGRGKNCLIIIEINDLIKPRDKALVLYWDYNQAQDILNKNLGKNLSNGNLEKLLPFRKLAGFYYDRKAVEILIKISGPLSSASPMELKARLAMLRFVQVAGELFERLLISTLNVDLDMLNKDILVDIRDSLSHLRLSKLNAMRDSLRETGLNNVFEKTKDDILRLRKTLENVSQHFVGKNQGSVSLWSYLIALEEIPRQEFPPWLGFNDLQNWLQERITVDPIGESQENGSRHDLTDENLEEAVEVFQLCESIHKRKSLFDKLVESEKHEIDFYKTFKKEAASFPRASKLTETECEFYRKRVTGLKKVIKDLSQCKNKKDEKIQIEKALKQKELDALRWAFVDEFMLDPDEYAKLNGLPSTKNDQEITKIVDDLNTIKACGRYGNLPGKYTDFVKSLKSKGVAISQNDQVFDWTRTPTSLVERLFHKVHKTGIIAVVNKHDLRCTRVKELLEVVNGLREMVGIETDLARIRKNATYREVIQSVVHLTNTIREYLNSNEQQRLYSIAKEFDSLKEEIIKPENANKTQELLTKVCKTHREYFKACSALQPTALQPNANHDEFRALVNDHRRRPRFSTNTVKKRLPEEEEQMKNLRRFHEDSEVTRSVKNSLNDEVLFRACQFLVPAFYEILGSMTNYPELADFKKEITVRHHYFHQDPFESTNLVVSEKEVKIPDQDPRGALAKEVSILSIGVKHILENLADRLQQPFSLISFWNWCGNL